MAASPFHRRPAPAIAGSRWAGWAVLGLVYPPRCAYCNVDLVDAGGAMFCAACRGMLVAADIPRCDRCGAGVTPHQNGAGACPRCKDRGFAFRTVLSIGTYENDLKTAVLRAKSRHQELLAGQLAELLWERRQAELAVCRPEVVAPVPMHWTRRVIRGANCSETLAERLARRLQVPLIPLLKRVRRTDRQGGLSRDARFQNLRQAFRVRRGCRCSGARVLLVDDIMTTGATSGEAAKALRLGGAGEISVAVLARAEGPD